MSSKADMPSIRASAVRMPKASAQKYLVELGLSWDISERLLDIASTYGYAAHPADTGILDVHFRGGAYHISLPEKKEGRNRREGIAAATSNAVGLKSIGKKNCHQREEKPVPRGKAQAEPEAPAAEEEPDYTVYASKAPTATMADFGEWLELEVFGGEYPGTAKERNAFLTGVRLGGTLRMEFQKSEFNIDRREARKAERVAGNGSDEADEEVAAPAKATRGRAKPGTAAASPAPAKPAPRRRGKAAASAEAPF